MSRTAPRTAPLTAEYNIVGSAISYSMCRTCVDVNFVYQPGNTYIASATLGLTDSTPEYVLDINAPSGSALSRVTTNFREVVLPGDPASKYHSHVRLVDGPDAYPLDTTVNVTVDVRLEGNDVNLYITRA